MNRATYNAKELAEVLGVSESMSYKLIRQMNVELAKNGFLTIRGKIPKAYVNTRLFGGISSVSGGVN